MGEEKKTAAIILAAGQGSRMKSGIQKQYMLLAGFPLLYYSLSQFQNFNDIQEVILVAGQGEIDFCKREIVEKYGFHKVSRIVEGGKERYHSVYQGLKALKPCGYVMIHDGARPLIDKDTIQRLLEEVKTWEACVPGMPVKDTIKISDDNGIAADTPDRKRLWAVQTPQTFSYPLIFQSYEKLFGNVEYQNGITDDAMVVERMAGKSVKLVEGSYSNIKITTPEDMLIAEALLSLKR